MNNNFHQFQYTDKDGYTYTITIRDDIKTLIFHMKMKNGNDNYICNMDYDYDSCRVKATTWSYIGNGAFPFVSIIAKPNFDMSTYRFGDTFWFNFETELSKNPYAYKGNYNDDANEHFTRSINYWNAMLTVLSGYGFKDIGFESFDEDPRIVPGHIVKVTGVSVSPTSESIEVGENLYLDVHVEPSDASDKTYKWSSSNPAVASVNYDGKITGNKPGKPEIIRNIRERDISVTVSGL